MTFLKLILRQASRKMKEKEGEMEAGREVTKREDVESDGKLSGKKEAFGPKKKISCQFPDGELWAADFNEEEESDGEEMSEEESDLRRELKWKTWQLGVFDIWISHIDY